ncbi:BtaA family protein [Fodinibius sp. Rm-B-1B1-1]|uniref:DUF3419 family protein n=1 Tax=Fodinibius alkaliphilus TaxID=3140241 RepID=UPI003159A602
MEFLSKISKNIQHHLFRAITQNNLVYNTSWEDPRIDRQLLELNANSKVLMLTGAGCNALDYLLDDVQQIDAVDINPAQNALLELKKAFYTNGSYSLLWDFLGNGQTYNPKKTYTKTLRPYLPPAAQKYWDAHIHKFAHQHNNSGFYFSGTAGKVAQLINWRIKQKGLSESIEKLLQSQSLNEQSYYFDEIEPQLWTPFSKWLVRRHTSMSMLGVPATQRKMIEQKYQRGMEEFIRQSLTHVFTQLPISDNYFWRIYLTGSYSPDCCPNYLRESNFNQLSNSINKITTHTSSLLQFLRHKSTNYSHFVLLDHQDWMAYVQPQKLAQEWRQILSHAQSGARILFRSAGSNLDFLPNFVWNQISFKTKRTQKLHQQDRVGTYESTHLAIVE